MSGINISANTSTSSHLLDIHLLNELNHLFKRVEIYNHLGDSHKTQEALKWALVIQERLYGQDHIEETKT